MTASMAALVWHGGEELGVDDFLLLWNTVDNDVGLISCDGGELDAACWLSGSGTGNDFAAKQVMIGPHILIYIRSR